MTFPFDIRNLKDTKAKMHSLVKLHVPEEFGAYKPVFARTDCGWRSYYTYVRAVLGLHECFSANVAMLISQSNLLSLITYLTKNNRK